MTSVALLANCCRHAGGSDVASSGSFQAAGVAGGANLRVPVGGAAKGIPKYWTAVPVDAEPDVTDVVWPTTTPDAMVTVGAEAAGAAATLSKQTNPK